MPVRFDFRTLDAGHHHTRYSLLSLMAALDQKAQVKQRRLQTLQDAVFTEGGVLDAGVEAEIQGLEVEIQSLMTEKLLTNSHCQYVIASMSRDLVPLHRQLDTASPKGSMSPETLSEVSSAQRPLDEENTFH